MVALGSSVYGGFESPSAGVTYLGRVMTPGTASEAVSVNARGSQYPFPLISTAGIGSGEPPAEEAPDQSLGAGLGPAPGGSWVEE